jgi:hypothetical protein
MLVYAVDCSGPQCSNLEASVRLYMLIAREMGNVIFAKSEERENQQDATVRCLLSTSVSTCFGHHYAHLQESKDRV